jgi:hypothetical protein
VPRIDHVDLLFNCTDDGAFPLPASNYVAFLSPIIKRRDSSMSTTETACTWLGAFLVLAVIFKNHYIQTPVFSPKLQLLSLKQRTIRIPKQDT